MRSFVRFVGIAAAVLLLMSSPPARADITWNVASGDWSSGGNWNGGVVPTSTDTADICNGGTATITQTGAMCYEVVLSTGTVEMTGGSLAVSNFAYVGCYTTGNFTQSGGTNSISTGLYVGYEPGSSGTYNLSGSGLLSAGWYEQVGLYGAGTFTQSGGTNNISSELYLSYFPGSSGTYNLYGSGLLSTGGVSVGEYATGNFTQSGGTNTISTFLALGEYAGGNGTYSLSGGQLSITGTFVDAGERIGCSGSGNFTQSGGTNSTGSLALAYSSGSSGTYSLSGSGLLSATNEYIGYYSAARALFQQTGGMNSVTYLSIDSGGRYQLSGGTLQINGGLTDSGIFDGGNSSAVLSSGSSCILDFSTGSVQNTGATVVSMGINSLLIVPAGFDTSTGFSSSSTLGLTHTAGTTLVVPAGQGFGGIGSINDPVICQGTITAATSGFINLNNGLTLSGTGAVALGSGTLTVSDTVSGISGGSISVNSQYVGSAGTGLFTQSGGANAISSYLYLGYNAGSSGTYSLSGSGLLSAEVEWVGYSGTGNCTQSGGTNSSYLLLGYNSGSSGTYGLSGSGLLSAGFEYVGYHGAGNFIQSGGTNASPFLGLGGASGSSGTYSLNGGILILPALAAAPAPRPSTSAVERSRPAARSPPSCP